MSHRLSRRWLWHRGLLYKIKKRFPTDLYTIIKSYLLHRTFRVEYGEKVIQLKEINFGIPQGSVLGPALYLLYITDLPVGLNSTTATYVDDSCTNNNHIEVSSRLQESLHHRDGLKNEESKPTEQNQYK